MPPVADIDVWSVDMFKTCIFLMRAHESFLNADDYPMLIRFSCGAFVANCGRSSPIVVFHFPGLPGGGLWRTRFMQVSSCLHHMPLFMQCMLG